jgi:hypothetical protein
MGTSYTDYVFSLYVVGQIDEPIKYDKLVYLMKI